MDFRNLIFSPYFFALSICLFLFLFWKYKRLLHWAKVLVMFQIFFWLFGRESYFGVESLALASPQNPLLAFTLGILLFLSKKNRKLAATGLLVILLFGKITLTLSSHGEFSSVSLFPAASEIAVVYEEDKKKIYISRNMPGGNEYYYKFSAEALLLIPAHKRQIFKRMISDTSFPVFLENENEIVLFDLKRRFLGKNSGISWSNETIEWVGPVF